MKAIVNGATANDINNAAHRVVSTVAKASGESNPVYEGGYLTVWDGVIPPGQPAHMAQIGHCEQMRAEQCYTRSLSQALELCTNPESPNRAVYVGHNTIVSFCGLGGWDKAVSAAIAVLLGWMDREKALEACNHSEYLTSILTVLDAEDSMGG